MPQMQSFLCAFLILGHPFGDGANSPDLIKIISKGEAFSLEKNLMPEKPTLVAFYQTSSSADKMVIDQLQAKTRSDGTVGLRLIALKSLDSAAARTFEIHMTPTLMVLDRFGKLLVRTSKVEEIAPSISKALKMARIKWVSESDAEAPKTYRSVGGGRSPVAGILKTMSLRPELLEGINRIAGMEHFTDGFLPRKTKEMIATYVSAINHCKF